MKRTGKIIRIAIAMLIISPSLTPMLSLAAADQTKPRRLAVLRGYGVAIDKSDDQTYRTRIRLLGEATIDAPEDVDASHPLDILRGGIAVLGNGTRTVYTVVNDTWSGTISRRGFVADGVVQDTDGNEYEVHLKGDGVRRTRRGILMLVEGEMDGDGAHYKLLYIAVLRHAPPRISEPIVR